MKTFSKLLFYFLCFITFMIIDFFKEGNAQGLPVDTYFKLPQPIPKWPQGSGFGSGIIDIGGLKLTQISTFKIWWSSYTGGPDDKGATFFEPSLIPKYFFSLGCYCQPNNVPNTGRVLVAQDAIRDGGPPALAPPSDYTLQFCTDLLTSKYGTKQDSSPVCVWLPVPPPNYKAVGLVVTPGYNKPKPISKNRCVRADFVEDCEIDEWIWGPTKDYKIGDLNFHSKRPKIRGVQAQGFSPGTFVIHNGTISDIPLSCLKNKNPNNASMPNLDQIKVLMQAYSPVVFFHPNEDYLPASVKWLFNTPGVELYKRGEETKPVRIDELGSNLPKGRLNETDYWIDLPFNENYRNLVKKGSLPNADAYVHVKPMLGQTVSDVAVWFFYPFNGPGKLKVEFLTISLGKVGEHVGDWEHVTLRVSNFDGELRSVYFSQHKGGEWVKNTQLEFAPNRNKPVVYSSLHGHAAYPQPGKHIVGPNKNVGIRNDCDKSKNWMDSGVRYWVMSAEYLGDVVPELPWLNYPCNWGPKLAFGISRDLEKIAKALPTGKLRNAFRNLVSSLPPELTGEKGPIGPKMKPNWYGDEN